MINCLVVGIGGFFGSVARYLFGMIPIRESAVFPVNTLLINVIGAFLIGLIAAESLNNQDMDPHYVLLLKVGLCGGFTTFSTFSLETMDLIDGGNHLIALLYVSCSILFCVAATMAAQIIISKDRNATINPMHFVDENMISKDLWQSVEGYVAKAYDMYEIETIRIHGDGGKWIGGGFKDADNVEYVIDGYHIEKYLKSIDNRFPCRSAGCRLRKALESQERDKVEYILGSLVRECESAKDLEKVKEVQSYLLSNWEAIVNRYREDVTGSCTEGLVSHVLSERFSRNPMGWSEEGLGKLSKLRVFCKNGGKIKAEHYKKDFKCDESYKAFAKHYLADEMSRFDLSWICDMREHYVFDTTSGTQQTIRKLGRIQSDRLC